MPTLEELEEQAKELRRVSREIDKKYRESTRHAAASSGPPPATSWVRTAALRVWALADITAAVEFLRWKGRRGDEDEVRAWLAGLPERERGSLAHPPDDQPRSLRQLCEACKFLEERQVVSWVKVQNATKRLAPTPGTVLDQGAASAGPSGRRSSRYKWLRRVVARWGGRKTVFRPSEQVPQSVLRQKAFRHTLRQPWVSISASTLPGGPLFGAGVRHLFWGATVAHS